MSRRPRWRVGRTLLGLLLVAAALLLLPVLALRWLPAPTSAFMLLSDTRPLRYQWVPASRIPDAARRAVVASEDQKFFEHRGFDIEAMEKAYAHNQKSKRRRGASTISQQTAKNLFLWSGGGYFRKGLEAGYTVLIEALWSKQRILTVYLNVAEFGPGIYGVEAAAQAFFNKSAASLTLTEAARLAAVLPSPRRWSVARPGPYVQKRTGWILRQMGAGPRAAPVEEPEPPPETDTDVGEPPAPADPGVEQPLQQQSEQTLQQQLEQEVHQRQAAPAELAAPAEPSIAPAPAEGSEPPPQ